MTKKILFCALLTLVANLSLAVGNNRPLTQPFDSLQIDGPFDVHIRKTSKQNLSVEADSAILPWVMSSTKNRELTIALKPGMHPHYRSRVLLTINTQQLLALTANNHAKIELEDFQTKNITIALNNHSLLNATLLRVDRTTQLLLNNHAIIHLNGNTEKLILNASNHSQCIADDFNSKSADITLSDHAKAKLSSEKVVTNASNHSSLKLSEGLQKISGHLENHSTTRIPEEGNIQSMLSNDSEYGLG